MNNIEINNKFKENLMMKNYDKCIEIVREIIINHIVYHINLNIDWPKYTYTNIRDLICFSEKYIKTDDKYIAGKINNYLYEETKEEKLDRLLTLCDTYSIKYKGA